MTETKLRILHLIDSGGLYGAEAVLLTLVEESIRMGHHAVVGSLADPGLDRKPIEAEAVRRGLPFVRMELGTFPGPMRVGSILRTIREQEIDLVHTHGYKANVLLGLLPRSWRPFPVVSTLHGWCGTRWFSKLRFYEWLDSRTLGHHDGVAVVSRRMLDLPTLAGRELPLLSVIPNAAAPLSPPPLGDGSADDIRTFCRRGFTFGSLGRLSVEKNFTALLEALVDLRERGLDAQLLILGEGRLRPDLSAFVERHQLAEQVRMPGYVENAGRYLPLLGAYVLSSTTEGMPISILEAMASGVPIVSTAVGDVPEMLDQGKAGLLVEAGDVSGLAAAMERVLRDSELREHLTREAERILKVRYSPAAMAGAYVDLYCRALQARSGKERNT